MSTLKFIDIVKFDHIRVPGSAKPDDSMPGSVTWAQLVSDGNVRYVLRAPSIEDWQSLLRSPSGGSNIRNDDREEFFSFHIIITR